NRQITRHQYGTVSRTREARKSEIIPDPDRAVKQLKLIKQSKTPFISWHLPCQSHFYQFSIIQST
ncbi:MAG: hypothetical protein KA150_01840, partial [Propionivibrio sp.]|nr:hypothetical protein [Propionivibrio sp.]